MNDRLLTVVEAADRMGMKQSTVRAKILKREWPYIKVGRSVRLRESFIESLINQGEVPARVKRIA
jgi:excisionase family DNA binding protein